jgi:glycine cleavage system H protein
MSAEYPSDLLYTKEHEWARIRGDVAIVGITRFAVEQLGDVTQLDLPQEGASVTREQVFGTVESVKAVSDLFAPVTGSIVRVNVALNDAPETLNEDPYQAGWLVEIQVTDKAELDGLMDVAAYQKLLAEHA